MADLKISELNALAGSDLASADLVAVVDNSASETKKLTVGNLIANGVTLISDDTIPGAKILFAAGDIATAAVADSAITAAKIADDAITAAKIADESTVDLVSELPASGAFTGQLAVDTDDNALYCWDGSAWLSLKASGSINTVSGSTTGVVNITATTTSGAVTIAATIDDTSAANQFLAGPTSAGGTVAYRTIDGTDLPVATTSSKGGVIVNAEGLRMDTDTIEIDNDVTASTTHHVVTYNAKGLITGGRVLAAADLPAATSSAKGAVIPGTGLTVDGSGNLDHSNSITTGTFTKVTVDAQGHVSSGTTLAAADIPDIPASKITSETFGSSLLATGAVTATKLANESVTKFGGAGATDNVVTFPDGDFKGQFFYDEKNEDLYVYTGTSFIPITVISGNLVNAGTYNANTNLITSVTSAGSAAGFTAGGALPAPATGNLNYYVVVDTSGTGSGNAPAVALAPPDMLISLGAAAATFQLIDVSNAIAGQTAANISVVATGDITSTDVQAALQELDTEKLPKAGGTMTGDLNLGDGVAIVFEGSTADEYETTITVTDPTADRTITFPNVTGNVVTTGDTGTVTSTMIADATIATGDIANDAVTAAKLADTAVTAGSYTNVDITVDAQGRITAAASGSNTPDDGSVTTAKLANDAVTTGKIAAGAVGTSDIADNAITAAKIAASAVDTSELATDAVTAAKIAAGAVDTSELAADAVTGAKIADNTINSEHYVDGSIDAVHLASNSVTNAKIADDAVGTAEIDNGVSILFAAGSAAAPSVAFDGDSDTGFYRQDTNSIGFSTNGTEVIRFTDSGDIYAPQVYSSTAAGSANVRVSSLGKLSRSVSSRKYKTNIETLQDSYADAILNCRPVWYQSLGEDDNPDHGHWGFIAEEVAEIDPRLVFYKDTEISYDESGSMTSTPSELEPEGVQYDRFVPHLLNLIKRQQEAIETLQTKVAALESA